MGRRPTARTRVFGAFNGSSSLSALTMCTKIYWEDDSRPQIARVYQLYEFCVENHFNISQFLVEKSEEPAMAELDYLQSDECLCDFGFLLNEILDEMNYEFYDDGEYLTVFGLTISEFEVLT